MKINILWRGQPLRIAMGTMMLVLILASGVNATKIINDNATGGNCKSFGTWDIKTRTCTMTKNLTEGIQIDSNNLILDGNGRTITGGEALVSRRGPLRTNVTIKNLNVKQAVNGIVLYNANGNSLINNNVYSNKDRGIFLYMSNDNIVTGNKVWDNGYSDSGSAAVNKLYSGLYVYKSSNNTISNNTISNNNLGIYLDISSNNNRLIDNIAISNKYGGIYIYMSNNNMISGTYI